VYVLRDLGHSLWHLSEEDIQCIQCDLQQINWDSETFKDAFVEKIFSKGFYHLNSFEKNILETHKMTDDGWDQH